MENALAAALLAQVGGVDQQVIAKVLKTFPGVAHRLNLCVHLMVDYINDSKGTMLMQLESTEGTRPITHCRRIRKRADFIPLAQAMPGRVKHVVIIGKVAKRWRKPLKVQGFLLFLGSSLEEAVGWHKAGTKR